MGIERRKNPIYRCPDDVRNKISENSVRLLIRRILEAKERQLYPIRSHS
jgi:hypothetical protein